MTQGDKAEGLEVELDAARAAEEEAAKGSEHVRRAINLVSRMEDVRSGLLWAGNQQFKRNSALGLAISSTHSAEGEEDGELPLTLKIFAAEAAVVAARKGRGAPQ